MTSIGYNERLFSKGFRKYLHLGRFGWLQATLKQLNVPCDSVVELGCFDGKTINHLGKLPTRYLGFDANWGGGLDLAREKWKDHPNFKFKCVTRPEEIAKATNETFDCAISMETLEHVPCDKVDEFIDVLETMTNGYIFITVPNEKGIVFLFKWIVKQLAFRKDLSTPYSVPDFLNAVIGNMRKVTRVEGTHKGFDYTDIIQKVGNRFDIIKVSGIPLNFLPLSFGIGIVAKKKTV